MPTTPAWSFLLFRAPTRSPRLVKPHFETKWRSLALGVAFAAAFVSGCNVTNSGLSDKLPAGGSGGALSFVSSASATADGIAGRAYGKVFVTSVNNFATTGYPVLQTATGGTGPISSCSVGSAVATGPTAEPSITPTVAVDSKGAGCLVSFTPAATSGGDQYSFTVQTLDSDSPARTASQAFTVHIRSEFTVTVPALPAAVQGRSYGKAPQTAPVVTTTLAAGSVGNPPVAATGCTATVTPSNPGFSFAVSGTTGCALSNTSASNFGVFNVGASVTDSPVIDSETNLAAVAGKTIASTGSSTLNIAAPLKLSALADGVSPTPPNGVMGRAYGTAATGCAPGPACLPLTYAVTGGLPAVEPADSYSFSAPGLAGSGLACATPVASATAKTTCVGTPTTAGTLNFTVTADDSGSANTATPSGSASSTTSSYTPTALTVKSPLIVTAPASAAAAVTGRSYGQAVTGCIPGPACAAIPYTVAGGLGGYSAATIVSQPGTWTCPLSGTTYSCSSASVGSPAALSLTASDTGDASTPVGTSNTATLALTVNGALTLTAPTSPAAAANGRAYGSNASVPNLALCGINGNAACAPASFTVSGGLTPYAATATTTSAPGVWVCPLGTTSYDCASPAVAAAGPYPTSANLSLNAVTDTANASTPGGTSSSATVSLVVVGNVTLTAPVGLATAVNGRAYGTGTGCTGGGGVCQPANFPVLGGLGSYAAANITSEPGVWTCPPVAGNYACSSGGVSNASTSTLTLNVSDVPNASTPSQASGPATVTLTINPTMILTPPATVPDTVTGRPFGFGPGCFPVNACAPIQYTVAGGLGNYQTGNLKIGAVDTLTCPVAAAVYSCSTPKINGITGAGLTMNAPETGNASTPSITATESSRNVNIDAGVTLTATQASPWPTAVQGRTYAEGGTQNLFNATGGIAPYVSFTPTNFPSGFNCFPSGASATCSSGDVLGGASVYSPAVAVVDTGDQSTPAATAVTDPLSVSTSSLTVNPALAINPITLPNALQNYPYPTISTAATLLATGGLGGNTWLGPGGTLSGACTSNPGGTIPPGITLASSSTTASLGGTPSTASPSAGYYAFQVCVTDTGNSMTPAGAALPNTAGNDLAIDVMSPYGYIAETTANEVEVVNTSTKATVTTISTGSGTAPYGVAFSPSGRYVYVTLAATDQLAIFDTITNAQTTSPASPIALTGCTTPHGVAATSAFIFVACNGTGNIDVVDTTAFGVTSIPTDSTSSQPEGIAIRADNLRVYVTLSAENELFAIDNSGASPVALTGLGITNPFTLLTSDGTIPFGIAVVPNGGGTLAYIAKQGASNTVPDGIEVVTLTNDAFTSSTSVATSADSSAIPSYVASSPDGTVVYVTLAGTDQFAVFANNASPAQITNSPFTLAAPAAVPQGVTIPVLSPVPSSTGYLVFISENAVNKLAVIDNLAAPVADGGSPITLSGTAPVAIASTPAPQ